MLTIYGVPRSRASRVIWAAEELGLEYTLKTVDLRTGEHRQEPYLSINPNGKIPAIQDGDLYLSESSAIVTYLAEKYFELGLVPASRTRERALYDQWMAYAISDLEPAVWSVTKQIVFLPEEQRSADIDKAGRESFERAAACLSQQLAKSDYVLGETFQAVDIILSSIVGWGKSMKMPGVDAHLLTYLERTQSRPAYQNYLKKYS